MKKLLLAVLITIAFVSVADAARIGGGSTIIKDDPIGHYTGEYKYSYPVTYVNYQGNTVTGTGWKYVGVSGSTMSACQSALTSAQSWGAQISQYCS
jgi:hypothetical protein